MTFARYIGNRYQPPTYWYHFFGTLRTGVKRSGFSEAALGSVNFAVKTSSQVTSGVQVTSLSHGWNSNYAPLLVASTGTPRLLLADAMTGENLRGYGTWGSGAGQFEKISGLARDSSGHIYVSDATLDRLIRIDNMNGTNWLQLGSFGVGNLHFQSPHGVAIDAAGRIWIADTGNNRVVRVDDMNGTNWTAFGTLGSAANQFNGPQAIAFDSMGRIYVADTGNGRLVRFDNLSGTNWISISAVTVSPYSYNLTGINGVVVLPSGTIFMSTQGGWTLSVADMSGAGGKAHNWGAAIAGISRDPGGAVYAAGSFNPAVAQTLDAIGAGYFGGNLAQTTLQPTAILSMSTTVAPPPVLTMSHGSLAFGDQTVGTASAPRPIALWNMGGGNTVLGSITSDSDFPITNLCAASLAGASRCTLELQFAPMSIGTKQTTVIVDSTGVYPVLKAYPTGTGTP